MSKPAKILALTPPAAIHGRSIFWSAHAIDRLRAFEELVAREKGRWIPFQSLHFDLSLWLPQLGLRDRFPRDWLMGDDHFLGTIADDVDLADLEAKVRSLIGPWAGYALDALGDKLEGKKAQAEAILREIYASETPILTENSAVPAAGHLAAMQLAKQALAGLELSSRGHQLMPVYSAQSSDTVTLMTWPEALPPFKKGGNPPRYKVSYKVTLSLFHEGMQTNDAVISVNVGRSFVEPREERFRDDGFLFYDQDCGRVINIPKGMRGHLANRAEGMATGCNPHDVLHGKASPNGSWAGAPKDSQFSPGRDMPMLDRSEVFDLIAQRLSGLGFEPFRLALDPVEPGRTKPGKKKIVPPPAGNAGQGDQGKRTKNAQLGAISFPKPIAGDEEGEMLYSCLLETKQATGQYLSRLKHKGQPIVVDVYGADPDIRHFLERSYKGAFADHVEFAFSDLPLEAHHAAGDKEHPLFKGKKFTDVFGIKRQLWTNHVRKQPPLGRYALVFGQWSFDSPKDDHLSSKPAGRAVLATKDCISQFIVPLDDMIYRGQPPKDFGTRIEMALRDLLFGASGILATAPLAESGLLNEKPFARHVFGLSLMQKNTNRRRGISKTERRLVATKVDLSTGIAEIMERHQGRWRWVPYRDGLCTLARNDAAAVVKGETGTSDQKEQFEEQIAFVLKQVAAHEGILFVDPTGGRLYSDDIWPWLQPQNFHGHPQIGGVEHPEVRVLKMETSAPLALSSMKVTDGRTPFRTQTPRVMPLSRRGGWITEGMRTQNARGVSYLGIQSGTGLPQNDDYPASHTLAVTSNYEMDEADVPELLMFTKILRSMSLNFQSYQSLPAPLCLHDRVAHIALPEMPDFEEA